MLEIHPSMFLLRWIRLLFCREFALEDVLYLWDRLFLHALPDFPAVPYLCTSILLGMRERIKGCESISMLLSAMQEGPRALNISAVWELTMWLWQVIEGEAAFNHRSTSLSPLKSDTAYFY